MKDFIGRLKKNFQKIFRACEPTPIFFKKVFGVNKDIHPAYT
tara:strand:- start:439 stop:564 length:126 start_codon:yes stop_codon:yes gene_type:complete